MSTPVKANIDRAIAFVRATTAGSPPREAVDELLATLMQAKARIEYLEVAVHARAANLRDQFAVGAMQGLIGTAASPCLHGLDGLENETAEAAYRMADAMLRARATQGGDL